jgi:hypothetical protein
VVAVIEHRFQSTKAQGPDPTLVGPTAWNDTHDGFEVFSKTADQTFSATTLANITDLSFPIAANEKVLGRAVLFFTSAAATTGAKFGLSGPSSPTAMISSAHVMESVTATRTGGLTAYGQIVAGANAVVTPAINEAIIEFNIENGANAGTVNLQAATEVANSNVIVKRGSYVQVVRYG